jgi:hypothetical protein
MDALKAVMAVVIYALTELLHMLVMKQGGHHQMVKIAIMALAAVVVAVVETVSKCCRKR